jgi:hypothetical protein
MTWSYPVYGPASKATRCFGCTCGAYVVVQELSDTGEISQAGTEAGAAFLAAHERCRDTTMQQEAP